MKTEVRKSEIHGLGVFAKADIAKDEVIEICPLIILAAEDTTYIDKTSLYNYYFAWENKENAIALGNGSLYNHSYSPNTIYQRDLVNKLIIFKALKQIVSGEEITINYNGNPNDQTKVWFDK